MEARSYVDVVGTAKIKIGDHVVSKVFNKVYYGGMWRGRPSLVVSIGARELGEVLRSSTLWQNQWFNYVVKLSLEERAARFLAAFALFDRSVYRFDIDVGMAVEKLYVPKIPGGCIYADVGLPMKMWRAAYAAYKDFQELEKWTPKRFRKRMKYVRLERTRRPVLTTLWSLYVSRLNSGATLLRSSECLIGIKQTMLAHT